VVAAVLSESLLPKKFGKDTLRDDVDTSTLLPPTRFIIDMSLLVFLLTVKNPTTATGNRKMKKVRAVLVTIMIMVMLY
jgi:hypothetical protein